MSFKLTGSSTPSSREKQPQGCPAQQVRWEPITLPTEVTKGLTTKAAGYLRERGFDPAQLIKRFHFCEWPELNRIVIPYFDRSGELIFLAARSFVGDTPKYMYPQGKKPLYVPARDIEGPAVVVEGQLDAVAVATAGFFAVALGGSYLCPHTEKDFQLEIRDKRVLILLDGDAVIKKVKLQMTLARLGIYAPIIPLNWQDDPASLGTERLKEILTDYA